MYRECNKKKLNIARQEKHRYQGLVLNVSDFHNFDHFYIRRNEMIIHAKSHTYNAIFIVVIISWEQRYHTATRPQLSALVACSTRTIAR